MIVAMPLRLALGVVLALLLVAGAAGAQAARVVLVKPAETNPTVTEALTRIRGELVADGFEVTQLEAPRAADPVASLGQARQRVAGALTLGLFVHADGSADLWVIDGLTNKSVQRRLEVEPGSTVPSAEVLARRAVDLLRASLLEVLVPQRRPAAVRAPAVAVRWAAKALEKQRSRWAAEAGALLLGGFGGINPGVLPLLRARFGFYERFAARLTLAGLGTRPEISAAGASASVNQETALVELLAFLGQPGSVQPLLSFGAGAYHMGVRGTALPPKEGRVDSQTVFALDAGVGLALPLAASFELEFEAHALLASPLPVVRFNDEIVARAGQPLLLAALTLVGWP